MANVKANQKDAVRNEAIQETVSKTDAFFKENKKALWGILIAVLVIAAAVLGYYKFIFTPKVEEAMEQTFPAENLFAAGEYETALNGDGNILGFVDIIDQYGNKAPKSVKMYAGVCEYMRGNFEQAISYLNQYSGKDEIMLARAKSCIGDAYVGLGNNEAAAKAFEAAAAVSENVFAATCLVKAGLAYEALGNKEAALKCYKTVKDNYPAGMYPNSLEVRDIDKYISRVEE